MAPAFPAVRDRAAYARGFDATVWGMPVVNYRLMFDALARVGGGFNQVAWWPRLLDWTNQTLTPNPDVIYLMPFFDTRAAGPIVLEIPPADGGVFNGSVMDCWQAAIEDVGPGGVDRGAGGKYLILPPGFAKEQVPAGYIPMPCDTFQGYALLRSVLRSGSDADVAQAVAYAQRIRLYPLSQAADPPATRFVDASGGVFDSTIPYDLRFFEALHRMVQDEPWLERDKAMIDPLKTIGIARGQPFAPDARLREVLQAALRDAHEWLIARLEAMPPFYAGRRWFFPATEEFARNVQEDFRVPDSFPVDARAVSYTLAFFSAKHLGRSQYYLMATKDRDGQALRCDAGYRLRVPPGVPASQYWSMTVYDGATHAFIREARWVGRSSQTPGLQVNADGSVDLFFGPAAPPAGASNWIPTNGAERFELLARFYGPGQALFDKSWQLEDIERTG